jgi:hypothetical protein
MVRKCWDPPPPGNEIWSKLGSDRIGGAWSIKRMGKEQLHAMNTKAILEMTMLDILKAGSRSLDVE